MYIIMTWKKEVVGIRFVHPVILVQSLNLILVVYLTRAYSYTYSIQLGVALLYKATMVSHWHYITHAVTSLYV